MDTHRVQVLHVTDGNGGVVGIAHDLVFDFLEALDALLHQDLMDGRQDQGVFHDLPELFFVIGKAAAGAAQGKGGTQDHRVADLFRGLQALFHGIGDHGGQDRLAQAFAQLLEHFPVFRLLDTAAGRTQKLDLAFFQDALLLQLHGQVQAGLAADAGDDGVGALLADNAGNIFQGQRLHVDLVRNGGVGHDGSGVGVAEDDFVALLFQRQAGLGARVVKFCRLADDDGAGTDYQDLLNIRSLRHVSLPPSWQ